MTAWLTPTLLPISDAMAALRQDGHACIAASEWMQAWDVDPRRLDALAQSWDRLPPDAYLKDGGRYRRRRHACVLGDGALRSPVRPVAHRAHWQPLDYNALHGGIERWFEPVEACVCEAPDWQRLMQGLAGCATAMRGPPPGGLWSMELHQFRIDTTDGIGRPTPEGAHRDGVDLVAVLLVSRCGVKGGETRVFDAHGPLGLRFTLTEPWTLLLLDDERVIHETTPIQPLQAGTPSHRDTLVVTCRAAGFQGPAVPEP